MSRLFTSESVTEGHPDKIADSISDAVLDALLEQDPVARVAVETLVTTGLVVLAGEVFGAPQLVGMVLVLGGVTAGQPFVVERVRRRRRAAARQEACLAA